ncbi:MAG: hypothetical protein HY966_07010, partial [Ignavibacteriales bacterium]|nr:hypothetical protein [Ignavibacteriales bacterium]
MMKESTQEESVRRFPLFFFCLVVGLAAGCTETQPNGTPVAKVNDRVLTVEMIKGNSSSSQPLTQNEIRQYAKRWVTNELLYQEAQFRGLDGSDAIQQKLIEAQKQLSIAELLEREVYASATNEIRTEDVAAYFQEHSEEFTLRETLIRLSVVIFGNVTPAADFRTAVLSGMEWDAAIGQYRNDASKGLLSYSDSIFYTRSSLYPQELWKVAGALGMSEISFPIQTSVGHIVLRSLG